MIASKNSFKPGFPQPLQRIPVVGIGDNTEFEPPVPECRKRLGDMRVGNDGLTDDPIIYWYRERIDYQDDTDENLSGRMLPVQTV